MANLGPGITPSSPSLLPIRNLPAGAQRNGNGIPLMVRTRRSPQPLPDRHLVPVRRSNDRRQKRVVIQTAATNAGLIARNVFIGGISRFVFTRICIYVFTLAGFGRRRSRRQPRRLGARHRGGAVRSPSGRKSQRAKSIPRQGTH